MELSVLFIKIGEVGDDGNGILFIELDSVVSVGEFKCKLWIWWIFVGLFIGVFFMVVSFVMFIGSVVMYVVFDLFVMSLFLFMYCGSIVVLCVNKICVINEQFGKLGIEDFVLVLVWFKVNVCDQVGCWGLLKIDCVVIGEVLDYFQVNLDVFIDVFSKKDNFDVQIECDVQCL